MPARIGRQCTVCRHVRRTELELALAGGAGQKAVARKYGVSKDAIHRHWLRHVDADRKARLLVGPVQRQALAARVAEENSSVLDNLRVIRAGLFESYDRALQAADRNSAALLAGKLHENLRITGNITGELASSPLVQQTTVNIFEHPAMARALDGIVELIRGALEADHPEALAAVLRAIQRAEQGHELAPALPAIEHDGQSHEAEVSEAT